MKARLQDLIGQPRAASAGTCDEFRDHPWYALTEEFCRVYDGPALDPRFDSMRLEEFAPMVRRVFATVKNSIYVPKAAAATV